MPAIIQRHLTIIPHLVTSSTIPSPTITDNMFNNIDNWSDSNDDFYEEVKSLCNYRELVRDECRLTSLVPEIELFCSIRLFSIEQWDNFNISMGELEASDINGDDNDDGHVADFSKKRKTHSPRSYHYKIGEYKSSTYYTKFLSDQVIRAPGGSTVTVREQTQRLSRHQKSTFRAWFRMPLYKIEMLSARFIDEGWVGLSHHCRTAEKLAIKTELLVLGALAILGGTVHSFRQLPTVTNICATEHNNFFLLFVGKLYETCNQYIYNPRNKNELKETMIRYEEVGLPGAMGSMDVVHVKWSRCPAGDFNRAKGKESYPSLAFQCISNFDRRICSVFGPQFGARNDKNIVKMCTGVKSIREDWYNSVTWSYFDGDGSIQQDVGGYLICDNGYLQWPISICPYLRSESNTSRQQCFSANLESVRKDVECVFGILKERWNCLQQGFKFRSIEVCRNIFVACCVLHNMMLDEMTKEDANSTIRRGICLPNDGIWLDGHTTLNEYDNSKENQKLSKEFNKRRDNLATHLHVWRMQSRR
ncbi:MAG: transposase family protein [Holophagaceae bacterium]